jgi:hypothetical protein
MWRGEFSSGSVGQLVDLHETGVSRFTGPGRSLGAQPHSGRAGSADSSDGHSAKKISREGADGPSHRKNRIKVSKNDFFGISGWSLMDGTV